MAFPDCLPALSNELPLSSSSHQVLIETDSITPLVVVVAAAVYTANERS